MNQIALDFIKAREKCRLIAYQDSGASKRRLAMADLGIGDDESADRSPSRLLPPFCHAVRLMNDYAQQNGYSIIMDGGPQMALYYVAPQIDLTEIMIKRFDSANPVEAGSIPPGPGTPPPNVVPKTGPVKPPLRTKP